MDERQTMNNHITRDEMADVRFRVEYYSSYLSVFR